MLRKLLKYDFRSIWRIWWIAAASALVCSFLGAFALRFLLSTTDTSTESISEIEILLTFMSGMIMFVSVLAILATVFISGLLTYWRFYKHFFSDEGYLTFTLPVSRKELLLSKTLNAMIWMVMQAVLIILCLFVFFLFSPPAEQGHFFNPVVFRSIGATFVLWSESVGGAGWLVTYILAGLLILAAALVFYTSLIHFCITGGSVLAKKNKILAAIGVYYLGNMVLSFAFNFVISIVTVLMSGRFEILLEALTPGAQHFAVLLLLLMVATLVAALASVMYCLTLGNLERKLNLA